MQVPGLRPWQVFGDAWRAADLDHGPAWFTGLCTAPPVAWGGVRLYRSARLRCRECCATACWSVRGRHGCGCRCAGGWGRSPNVSLTDAANTETIVAPEGSAAGREPLISTQWSAPAAIPHPAAPTPHRPAAVPLPATRRARTAIARAWRRVL